MHAFWSGSITFGLVNIPIKVFSGAEDKGIDFDMLHKKDRSRIRYQRVCEAEGTEVSFKDIVKGYAIEAGEYVVLTDEDFKAANVRKTHVIEIFEFIKDDEVDTVYYEKPYYLEAGKGAGRPYALLVKALHESKRVALASFVFRNREKIGIVRPYGDYLVLNQLRYQSQLRNASELEAPEHRVSKKELDMALNLIESLSGKFEPEKYHDTYQEDLLRIIKEKAKGQTPTRVGEEPKPTTAYDLMEVLRQSLEGATGATERPRAKPAAKAAASRRRPSRAAKKTATKRASVHGKARRRKA